MDITTALPLIVVVGVIIASIWRNAKKKRTGSFWDLVRNPDRMPDFDKILKDIEDVAASVSGSREEVARLVDFFVFEAKSSDHAWREKRIIARLGEEAYPRALEILHDKSNCERLVVLTGDENSLREAPICRLLEIFDQDMPPPPAAAGLLSPFLRSEHAAIRKKAALVIGSIGAGQSIPDLELAIKDQDHFVKTYALMGLQRAISGERIENSAKSRFYEFVEGINFNVFHGIPRMLLGLDRERAVTRLLEPDLFSAKFKSVWGILDAFAKESVPVSREKLRDLIEEANKEPIEYPMGNVLETALALLGQHRIEDDLPTLERLVDHPNEDVSRGAIQGLYSYHRFFDMIRNPWDVVDSVGWDALTESERHICAIEQLVAEVNNGGFAQYYFNSAGNHWEDALNGLAAIGASKRHKLMAATIERFGHSKPSSVRTARTAQLSKVVRQEEDPFSKQDKFWLEAHDEPLDRLIFRYNLANMHGRSKERGLQAGGATE